MTQEINGITSLFKNHINKDIDQNFVDALEALLFLVNPSQEEFNKTFFHKLPFDTSASSLEELAQLQQKEQDYIKQQYMENKNKSSNLGGWVDDWSRSQDEEDSYGVSNTAKSIGQLLKQAEKNNQTSNSSFNDLVKKSPTKFKEHGSYYNPTDMLIAKLVENLRRMYAANKAQDKKEFNNSTSIKNAFGLFNNAKSHQSNYKSSEPLNNENKLQQQQDLIYKAFSLIEQFAFFSPDKKWFEKSILGSHSIIKPIELWAFLGMHEYIQPNNREQHLSIFKSNINNISFSTELLKKMSTVVHQPSQTPLLQEILKHTDIKTLCDVSFTRSSTIKHSWMLSVSDYLFNPDNKIPNFTDKERKMALNNILCGTLFDSPYFSKYIEEPSEFYKHLKEQTSSSDFDSFYKSMISNVNLQEIGKNKTTDFILSNIKSLNDTNYLVNTIKNNYASEEQKQEIFKLYDFNDFNMLKNVASNVHTSTVEGNRSKVMTSFMTCHANALSKELITHIISLDSSYMPICKAAYMQIRVSERLVEKDTGDIANKKHKI